MSVVAVRVHRDQITIASDSLTSYGDTAVYRSTSIADDKLWCTSAGVVVGFVGTSALGSVLRRWTMAHVPDGDGERAITAYVDAFNRWRRDEFPDAGDIDDMSFLLVYRGTAWTIDGYSISAVPTSGYMAIGSGMPVALGALYHGASVVEAVIAACEHTLNCGLPVVEATVRVDGQVMGSIERLACVLADTEQAAD